MHQRGSIDHWIPKKCEVNTPIEKNLCISFQQCQSLAPVPGNRRNHAVLSLEIIAASRSASGD